MLQNIRDNTQGTMAKVIIGLISIPFVLAGAESLLGNFSNDTVAKINGEEISAQELQEAMSLEKRRLSQSMGDDIQTDLLSDENVRQPALDSLITRKLTLLTAEDLGMAVSAREVNKVIVQNEDFYEDGQFSKDKYNRLLVQAGLNSEIYKRLYTSDVLNNQYASGYVNTGFVTNKSLEINNKFLQQTRDIRYIQMSFDDVQASVEATEEEVSNFYNDNPEQFQSEETVVVEYIELELNSYLKEVSEEDIKAAYDAEIAKNESEKQKQVSHILFDLSEFSEEEAIQKLTDIKQQVESGAKFADLAKEFSKDLGSKETGGFLGVLDPDAFPSEFVAAAEVLEEGEVSEPVVTSAGVHLIEMSQVLVADVASYEERKEQLATEIQLANAEPEFWQDVEELKNVSFNSIDLIEPSEVFEVKIKESAPIKTDGGTGIFADPNVYKVVYSATVLEDKQNSDVIELDGKAVVLRVKQHNVPDLLPFDDVAQQAEAQVISNKASALLEEKAATIISALQSGADVEALAKEHGQEWQLILKADRAKAGADKVILDAAFLFP